MKGLVNQFHLPQDVSLIVAYRVLLHFRSVECVVLIQVLKQSLPARRDTYGSLQSEIYSRYCPDSWCPLHEKSSEVGFGIFGNFLREVQASEIGFGNRVVAGGS